MNLRKGRILLKMYFFVYGSFFFYNSYNFLLNGCKFIGKVILEGFGFYKVSWYLVILLKENLKVLGEVY